MDIGGSDGLGLGVLEGDEMRLVDLDGSISLILFLDFVKILWRNFFKHSWVDGLELRMFDGGLDSELYSGWMIWIDGLADGWTNALVLQGLEGNYKIIPL